MFTFTIENKDASSLARVGSFQTPHGTLHTPNLAFVATNGYFKAVPKEEVPDQPIDYAIVNTFHILVKNILEEIEKENGIHKYMNYPNVCSSDSGGFQVFSLGFGKTHGTNKVGAIFPGQEIHYSDEENPIKINENGVEFTYDNIPVELTPERSMAIQHAIGADIIFAFDECTSPMNSYEYTKKALTRTHRWLDRCIMAHKTQSASQALFGIIQGGEYEDLRLKSAQHLAILDVPGYGIGGSLGKTKDDMHNILTWIIPCLPDEKPRHLLGIGNVRDIFESVERGIDLFDCVIPTREARHRILYTKKGKMHVKQSRVNEIQTCIDEHSPLSKENVSIQQLSDWFSERSSHAYYYATKHNMYFFSQLMSDIRQGIGNSRFSKLKEEMLRYY